VALGAGLAQLCPCIKGRREHLIMGSRACQCDQTRRGSWVPHTNTGHDGAHHPIEYLHEKRKQGMYKMFVFKKKMYEMFHDQKEAGNVFATFQLYAC